MPCDPRITPDGAELQLVFDSDPFAVRRALAALTTGLAPHLPVPTDRDTVEIVLAEVLNNVVEHAYRAGPGRIELRIRPTAEGLICAIADHGLPMPGGMLPQGLLSTPATTDSLPEGGYGWHLIRMLSQDLCYCRDRGRNCLSFRLARTQSAPFQ
ncbi:MAG: ATP-binding protein [Rhodobacteraceae bacterium]|nr:ATP-binding protein [Paracoccaceae bacterium]